MSGNFPKILEKIPENFPIFPIRGRGHPIMAKIGSININTDEHDDIGLSAYADDGMAGGGFRWTSSETDGRSAIGREHNRKRQRR
jgi:hypothetical protein